LKSKQQKARTNEEYFQKCLQAGKVKQQVTKENAKGKIKS
jgi:hypothetical protein